MQIISASQGVNLTTLSDVNGNVYLPGAQPATDYQVSVTKSGYSTAQTYARDSTNQNPTPGYMTVVKKSDHNRNFRRRCSWFVSIEDIFAYRYRDF